MAGFHGFYSVRVRIFDVMSPKKDTKIDAAIPKGACAT